MSLVSYAASDDDSDSEQEISSQPVRQKLPETNAFSNSATSNSGINLPAPRRFGDEATQNSNKDTTVNQTWLSALPKPKTEAVLTSKEVEIEDFVKKNAENLRSNAKKDSKPDLPKKRKLIKIAAPKLTNSDSDDDDYVSKNQFQPAASKKICGLFSVLPAPKNRTLGGGTDSNNEIGKMFSGALKKPNSNVSSQKTIATAVLPTATMVAKTSVPMVPASLSRKPNQSSRSAFNLETGMMMTHRKKNIANQQHNVTSQSESERGNTDPAESKSKSKAASIDVDSSDDEGGETSISNFFSIGGGAKDDIVHSNPLSASSLSVTSSVSTLPSVGSKESEAEKSGIPSPDFQDQPLSFISRHNNPMQDTASHFNHTNASQQPLSVSSTSRGYSNVHYNMAAAYPENESEVGTSTDAVADTFEQDKEFLKIQGKSKRGKEEINFIDVRQSDQIGEVDLNLIKNLSEENASRQSYSKKKNDDMPTSQQRKKHQITYLAFKAKEREVELKDAWAANRQTKRQTQSKYGF